MKKAGDILNQIFDNPVFGKASEYSKIFASWREIVGERIAVHSKIKQYESGIIMIEVEHPGWKQIILFDQAKILQKLRRRFPDLPISGLAIFITRG